MRANIEAEDEQRRLKASLIEAEESRKRQEKNRQEYELQLKLTKKLEKEAD